jgi:hypothetical protein
MPINYQSRISPESKMRSPDRILKLEIMDGRKPLGSTGNTDPRLFKEDGPETNQLHAVMDLETSLWSIKYDKGAIPAALAGRFTGFKQLYDHAKNYFAKRNINITQVLD